MSKLASFALAGALTIIMIAYDGFVGSGVLLHSTHYVIFFGIAFLVYREFGE